MAAGEINLILADILTPNEWAEIDGHLFQIHLLDGNLLHPNKLKLIPVKLKTDLERCPIIIGGEQCGGRPGHEGKHFWAGGD